MVRRGEPGSIVNIISMPALGGQPYLAPYVEVAAGLRSSRCTVRLPLLFRHEDLRRKGAANPPSGDQQQHAGNETVNAEQLR